MPECEGGRTAPIPALAPVMSTVLPMRREALKTDMSRRWVLWSWLVKMAVRTTEECLSSTVCTKREGARACWRRNTCGIDGSRPREARSCYL